MAKQERTRTMKRWYTCPKCERDVGEYGEPPKGLDHLCYVCWNAVKAILRG